MYKRQDLKSGKTFEVKKGDDQYLRPLGFIGEDFIYGQANAADVVSDEMCIRDRLQYNNLR